MRNGCFSYDGAAMMRTANWKTGAGLWTASQRVGSLFAKTILKDQGSLRPQNRADPPEIFIFHHFTPYSTQGSRL